MGWFFIILVVCAITTTALLVKFAVRRQIESLDLAFSMFVVSTALGGGILWLAWPVNITFNSVVHAVLAGIGGSGAVVAFNLALERGHFGFSNAIYRSAFVLPVIYSLVFMNGVLKSTIALGIMCILVAIFLMSWSTGSFAKGGQFRWFLLIMTAFLLSGVPRIAQNLTVSRGEDKYFYAFVSYAAGAAVLGIAILWKRKFRGMSLAWGSGLAVASYIGVFSTLKALEFLKAEIVFPITLAGPVILGILFSVFFFREKINLCGWGGVLLGLCGIAVLAIWK